MNTKHLIDSTLISTSLNDRCMTGKRLGMMSLHAGRVRSDKEDILTLR
ncbi:hypothetical protein J5690_06440 [bacterium]|nr:hypothetical protein [bacterium]